MSRILVVEDEPAIAELIAINLRHAGFEVTVAADADAAQDAVDGVLPALVVLDWMLPGRSGYVLVRQWRAVPRTRGLPVIMLTARSEEADKVSGLDAGADDYLTKPFALPELEARVRALTRRAGHGGAAIVELGPLTYDTVGRVARLHGEPLDLSARELSLLQLLISRAGRMVSKEQIVDNLCQWGEELSPNAVEVYVHRLRKKLEPGGVRISTLRGLGYCVADNSARSN